MDLLRIKNSASIMRNTQTTIQFTNSSVSIDNGIVFGYDCKCIVDAKFFTKTPRSNPRGFCVLNK